MNPTAQEELACLILSYESDPPHVPSPGLPDIDPDTEDYPVVEPANLRAWLAQEHFGDCTKQSCPCLRCHADQAYHKAGWLLKRFDPMADPDTGFVALAALSYTIGRRTYAPSLVSSWLQKYWTRFPSGTRANAKRDLNEAIERAERLGTSESLGDDCDRDTWYDLKQWIDDQD